MKTMSNKFCRSGTRTPFVKKFFGKKKFKKTFFSTKKVLENLCFSYNRRLSLDKSKQ